ncbi:MAG: GNAT family N-acetyltransferase [Nocardioidaceae bacterium]
MTRRLVPVTADNVADLPTPCLDCTFWETGRSNRSLNDAHRASGDDKNDWVSSVLLEWGRCGRIVYVDGEVAGFALYAPAKYVAGRPPFGAGPPSRDSVVLMSARIMPEFTEAGLGRVLIQSVVKDALRRRGARSLEAYGDVLSQPLQCFLPVDFLTAVGFRTVHQHPRYPLLRLELRNVMWWRSEVEEALERWLGALRPEVARGPAGVSPRADPEGALRRR